MKKAKKANGSATTESKTESKTDTSSSPK
jgi:hypothetical protein